MATLAVLVLVAVCARLGARSENRTEMNRHDAVARFRSFQACVNNFEIHTDKIIRTDDSRRMGAQYISETDVQTRDECVRLCCTTEMCDVFVFEDKRPGSCYLFNCGSSDDFKCKFTKHHNYTSGIMTESHQVSDPRERDLPSKHEQELNLLRMSQEPSGVNRTAPMAQLQGSGVGQSAAAERAKENKTLDPPPSERNTCSRFQFKCRMSGECIAIYNACDGIPQCADGSDESAELNCPIAVTSSLIPVVAPSNRIKSDPDPPAPAYDSGYQHPPKEQAVGGVLLKSADPEVEARGPLEGNSAAERNAAAAAAAFHNLNAYDAKPRLSEEPPLKAAAQYEELPHLQPHFTKPDDMMQNNPPPTYTGYRPYMDVRRGNVEEERSHLAARVMNERTEHAYRSKFPDAQFQKFLQEQSGMKKVPVANEAAVPFQHLQHSGNPFPMQPAEALRHLSQGPEAPMKEDLRREGFDPSGFVHSHDANMQKAKNENLELDYNNPVARNEMKMPTQIASYADPPLHEMPPARLYKYEDENRHIFTHKGFGLVADGDRPEMAHKLVVPGVRYNADHENNGRHILPNREGQNPLVAPEHPTAQDKLLKMLKNTPGALEGENGYLVPADYQYEEELQLHPQAVNPNPPTQHDFHHRVEPATAHSMKPSENTSSSVEEKPSEQLRKAQTHVEVAESKEAEKHSFVRSHREHVVGVQQADVLQVPDEHESDRPSGALLSMSFGLCITLIMAVLVACRLKVVKRRFRRNGKSMYAHDADYLVNGMYL